MKATTPKDQLESIILTSIIKELSKPENLEHIKIEIYYNYTKNKSPDDDDHRGFCFYEEIIEPEKMKYGKSAVSGVVKMKMKLYA